MKVEGREGAYVDFDVRTAIADNNEEDRPNGGKPGNWFRRCEKWGIPILASSPAASTEVSSSLPYCDRTFQHTSTPPLPTSNSTFIVIFVPDIGDTSGGPGSLIPGLYPDSKLRQMIFGIA
ncbi:hypothetical protein GALMADRAFT_148650 [Galerina marginata CBS 339.88]|uniref:Uncharacterized protein n=1 Tax=Galerina marginata (strain CBS 339.88) TaxID=685588 RepID=A0A067S3V8_GALM3|nr:hypothetical protein GALMADRAFT_148650 [Galerina marginata CBS 339.88]